MKKLSISELYETLTEAQIRNVLLGSFSNELKKSLSNNNLKTNDLQNYAEAVHKQKALVAKEAKQEEERAIQEQIDEERKAKLAAEAAARQEQIEVEEEEVIVEKITTTPPTEQKQEEKEVVNEQTNTQKDIAEIKKVIADAKIFLDKKMTIEEKVEQAARLMALSQKKEVIVKELKELNSFINAPHHNQTQFKLTSGNNNSNNSYEFKTYNQDLVNIAAKSLQQFLKDSVESLDNEMNNLIIY